MVEKGKPSKLLFGELLLEYGVVTREQIKKALEWQIRVGGRIGSILSEMGYLDDDSLVNFLGRQFNASPANLFEVKVPPETLNLLSFERVKALHALPIKESGGNITLAMIDPHDLNTIQGIEFALNRRIEPAVTPCYHMERAINYFEEEGYGNKVFDGEKLKMKLTTDEENTTDVYSLLKYTVEHKATDLHLTAGIPPSVRIDNEIRRLSLPSITPAQMVDFVQEILTKEQKEAFVRDKEIDFAVSIPHIGRFRMNIYKQRGSISLSARHVIEDIPSLEALGLPEWITDYALKPQGFILITGPSGHGKTTTMSALIDVINTKRRCNVVTLEDPIEYLHRHKKSNVNQREVGIDTESFSAGLKRIFRQNPDVIVIGEMRDPESIAVALTAAETGHMVISTMHSQNSTMALDRIIDVFPEYQQRQIRLQFSDAFLLVFAQRLVPKKDGEGRVLAYEKMTNSFRVRNLIREGKTFNIRSLMQVSSADVSSIDTSLARLCKKGQITFEDGLRFADNAAYYQEIVKAGAPRQ